MADLFVSYARRDKAVVSRLTETLEAADYTVWWDQFMGGGQEFAARIQDEIKRARAVVVVWSKSSVESPWVRDEASLALSQGKLVPITIDDTPPPLGFGQIHAISFSTWQDDGDETAIVQLAQAIQETVSDAKPRLAGYDRSGAKRANGLRFRMIASATIAVALAASGAAVWWSQDRAMQIAQTPLPIASSDRVTVYVARLHGDTDDFQYTRQLLDSLRFALSEAVANADASAPDPSDASDALVAIDSLPRTVAVVGDGGRDSLAAAEADAKRWLAATSGDVLIWGEAAPDFGAISLRITTSDGTKLGRYGFEDLRVGEPVFDDLAPMIVGAALAQVADIDVVESPTQIMGAIIRRLKPIAETPPAGLNRAMVRDLRKAYADIVVEYGQAVAGRPFFNDAVALLEDELARTAIDKDPIAWAELQNSLAFAFLNLGEHGGELSAIHRSIDASRAALTVFTRDMRPDDWAHAHRRLGQALYERGKRDDIRYVDEAIRAFDAAGQIWTRQDKPRSWASLQRDIGQAYNRLGYRENDEALLLKAAAAYKGALEIVTREDSPKEWAYLNIDLGNTYFSLAKYQISIDAYHKALEVLTAEKDPLDWSAAQLNLGAALVSMGRARGDRAQIRDGIAAYQAALSVQTRERSSQYWANLQHHLGLAYLDLADLGDFPSLDAALEHFDLALLETPKSDARFYWAETQFFRGRVLIRMAERGGDVALAESAIPILEACVEIFDGQDSTLRSEAEEWLDRGRKYLTSD